MEQNGIRHLFDSLMGRTVSPMALLPHDDLREKLIDLVLNGEPRGYDQELSRGFEDLSRAITTQVVDDVRVVVFGGGTGLSNIIGGDSRLEGWGENPFKGLKSIFPATRSVVCVTDDGGSTGELLKDLPLVALGDIRHVLLSSVQLVNLQRTYQITAEQAQEVASILAVIFNHRFTTLSGTAVSILREVCPRVDHLPKGLHDTLQRLAAILFSDKRLRPTLGRPHCLGNLLVVAAVYSHVEPELSNRDLADNPEFLHDALYAGLSDLFLVLGVATDGVLPCTTTPSQLRMVYANGVQTTGESKSSDSRRGVPVESVHVDYCSEPRVFARMLRRIEEADVIILAPGSLYSSIIPVFKAPGIAEAVRRNRGALKMLVANLWVQAGETDLSLSDPERKFRVSDMIRAYERNIPGGTAGLFREVLCLSMKDVPASVIQSYAVEGKVPIYLDRTVVRDQGYIPVECGIFSRRALEERGVIQHDPATLAQAVKVLYVASGCFDDGGGTGDGQRRAVSTSAGIVTDRVVPSVRYERIVNRLAEYSLEWTADSPVLDRAALIEMLALIIWKHHDIPISHLGYARGVRCVDPSSWPRNQRWDNVYSFYDPENMLITIRADQLKSTDTLETPLLIAIGQSLLGSYAAEKRVEAMRVGGSFLGKIYHLVLREEGERVTFFNGEQLDDYLRFARMYPGEDLNHYTRLINGDEGFTPPGLLMGLLYAWYLDNTLASHIEYKMAVMKIPQTDLIPEQKRMVGRRRKMISFFREIVFR